MRIFYCALSLSLVALLSSPVRGQQNSNDVEVRDIDILRTCREIHRAAQVQEPTASATPQGITFNCRLVNTNGSTIAQVSPEDVCERLTGSREWYRGAGTQVFCSAAGEKVRPTPTPCPQPTDEQIYPQDVARACQKVHRNNNAAAEPLRMTVNGPDFKCRLANSAGFTIAGVTPEQVCDVKTGREPWCYTETTTYCRGADYEEPINPNPNPNPNQLPGLKSETPEPKKPEAGEIEGESEAKDIGFCTAGKPGDDVVVRITGYQKPRKGYGALMTPLVTCGSGKSVLPETLCPSITGRPDWYMSANGFKTTNGVLWPNWIAVCRGSGPRQRIAHADIERVCQARGWRSANNGITANREPVCHDMKGGKKEPISVADICNTLFATSEWKVIGITHWCLP